MDPNKLKHGDEIKVTLRGKVTRVHPDTASLAGSVTVQFDGASEEGRNYFRTNVLEKAIKLEVIVPVPAIGDVLTSASGSPYVIVGFFEGDWIVKPGATLEGNTNRPYIHTPSVFAGYTRTPAKKETNS